MRYNKHILLTFLVVAMLGGGLKAQNISVTSAQGQNVGTFVNAQLVGSGVYVWNVKFNNSTSSTFGSSQIGTFRSNGYPKLQMDSGVVMTTGNISVAVGPNNTGSASNTATGSWTDAVMNAYLSGTSVTSCATIDFDFVSISPYVTMNYCFGSEEYPNYVWSSYNDVFAFRVTGPSPTTGQSVTKNIAIIPHTTSSSNPNGIPVAINTVNGKTSGGNTSQGQYHYNEFFVQNYTSESDWASGNGASGVQYNGFTQKLSANATLVPCAQYHMHISICNAGDDSYDSGVFLEKKSFTSPSADVDLSLRYADSVERSRSRVVPLTLDGTSYSYGRVVVSFAGDAVVGRDYTVVTDSNRTLDLSHNLFYIDDLPHSLTLRATDTADLTSPRNVEIRLATSLCEDHLELKTYDTLRFVLVEDDVLRLRHDTIVAYDTCREVGVEVVIGQPTTFHWMPEDGIDFPRQQYSSAFITESRTYRVAAADDRGHTDTTTVYIDIRSSNAIEAPQAAEVRVYPNPAQGRLTVDAPGLRQLELYRVDGTRCLMRQAMGASVQVDTRTLPAGVYILRVATDAGVSTERVIIQ